MYVGNDCKLGISPNRYTLPVVNEVKWIDYKTRLLRLRVDSFEIRRLRQDLLYAHRIVFDLVNNEAI